MTNSTTQYFNLRLTEDELKTVERVFRERAHNAYDIGTRYKRPRLKKYADHFFEIAEKAKAVLIDA